MCNGVNCKDVKHRRDLCSMYNDIVSALYEGSKPYYKHKNKTHNIRSGWNKYDKAETWTETRQNAGLG